MSESKLSERDYKKAKEYQKMLRFAQRQLIKEMVPNNADYNAQIHQ